MVVRNCECGGPYCDTCLDCLPAFAYCDVERTAQCRGVSEVIGRTGADRGTPKNFGCVGSEESNEWWGGGKKTDTGGGKRGKAFTGRPCL